MAQGKDGVPIDRISPRNPFGPKARGRRGVLCADALVLLLKSRVFYCPDKTTPPLSLSRTRACR